MASLAVFLFSLFILQLQHHQCTSVKSEDNDPLDSKQRQALIDFNNTVRHSPNLFWNPLDRACDWKGVTCDPENKTVLWFQLPGKSLVGVIPPDTIGKLTSLRVLSLRFNGLYGNIPSDFSNLTTLTHLSLNNNYFNGTIPIGFSNLINLVRLSLDDNYFSGQLPFIEANKLAVFNVSFNKFNSSIPSLYSKFPITVFDVNVFLCGRPTTVKCNSSYPSPDFKPQEEKKKNLKGEIVGISVASGVLLLILLCCARKKIYQQTKQHPSVDISSSRGGASTKEESNKLVLLEDGVYSFDLEDLLKASAEVLGEGRGGTSYKQVIHEKNTTVVVKRLKDVVVTETEFRKTMEVLGKVKDRNVVALIGYYYSKDEKMLVYEYMPAGSLFAHLHGSRRPQLYWDHRMRIAVSVAKGLAYLHADKKIVHGNIKSSNILIRQETNNEASLSDYGLNMLFGESSSLNHHVTGYWAPEVLNPRQVTFESDVYSFGVLLLELLTGETPKQASLGNDGVNFSKWVVSIVYEEPKAEIFDAELRRDHNIEEMLQLLHIAKSCVSIVPDQRPTMENVVSMMDAMWLRQSSDDHSKGYDYTPSTENRDTPSTITP